VLIAQSVLITASIRSETLILSAVAADCLASVSQNAAGRREAGAVYSLTSEVICCSDNRPQATDIVRRLSVLTEAPVLNLNSV